MTINMEQLPAVSIVARSFLVMWRAKGILPKCIASIDISSHPRHISGREHPVLPIFADADVEARPLCAHGFCSREALKI